MTSRFELLLEQFLSTHRSVFSLKDVETFLKKLRMPAVRQEIQSYLEECGLVFSLSDGYYISRAGAFTGAVFSIKPSSFEFDSDIIIQGDRCIPFVDPEIPSDDLIFMIDGIRLPQKSAVFDSDEAIDKFMLFGEEYAPQYIAADPANEGLDVMAVSGELSNSVNLTGLDMSLLKTRYAFERGDRLVCRVIDWQKGIIEFYVQHDSKNRFNVGEIGEKRLAWYRKLENYLLESFEASGPCASIEEQLAGVFFDHRDELCIPECGSVEEFLLEGNRKIALENFGVETRLWYRGKSAPAVGKWNKAALRKISKDLMHSVQTGLYYNLPDEVLDQAVLDMYYRHKDNLGDLFTSLFPDDYQFHEGERERIMVHLSERDACFKPCYNWFTDQRAGPIRNQSLELFKKVNSMLYKIDGCDGDLNDFPQQELVILTQLYSHLLNILSYSYSDKDVENDSDAILVSIDGMKWNYEDIEEILLGAIDENTCSRFKVVK